MQQGRDDGHPTASSRYRRPNPDQGESPGSTFAARFPPCHPAATRPSPTVPPLCYPRVVLDDTYAVRFAGLARLYGTTGLDRLRAARVLVVGLGGVGSWVVEALARSGIGALTLVDLDEVCLSNVNRQLPALDGNVGRFKAEVLADRVRAIHPGCEVQARTEFFTEDNAEAMLAEPWSAVVDAIDAVANKCRLIAGARARNLPVVASGGAGGRRDGTQFRIADLADVTHDRLLAEVRRRLRKEHDFPPAGKRMGIPCVFSTEPLIVPRRDGTVCRAEERAATEAGGEGPPSAEGAGSEGSGEVRRLNCDWGYGSASFVTGAAGLAAAGWVVGHIANG